MITITIYHGSPMIIEKPLLEMGKMYNDYGRGFYCTENPEIAKEWACLEGINGYINQYEFCMDHIKVLNLNQYTILHWLTILMEHRRPRISTPVMQRGIHWLRENYHMDTSAYDVIIGYRADDSYFSFVRGFLNNEISLSQLGNAMKLGKLGEQFVLVSPKAFETIKYCTYESVDCSIYYVKRKARDEAARAAYRLELEKEAIDDIYMQDILRGQVRIDDIRLQ